MLELVREAVNGDREAFCELVRRNWSRLIRIARSITGPEDAEDLVQEGFLTVWKKMKGLRDPEMFQSWISKIVIRKCLSFARRQAIFSLLDILPETPVLTSASVGIDIARLMASLPPKQRAVMHLTAVEGMTDSEIAVLLAIRPGSVRAHRRRARERLVALLGGKP